MSYHNDAIMNEEFDFLLVGHEGKPPVLDNRVEPDVFEINADAFITIEDVPAPRRITFDMIPDLFFGM